MHALISGNPFTLGLSIARLKDSIRQVEKAVIARLPKQKPVAWRVHPFDYGIGVEGAYAITQQEDMQEIWERKEWEVTPLYAHPMPGHIPGIGQTILEGWQLVSKEPTDSMLACAKYAQQREQADRNSTSYRAMLAAAPKYTGDSNE